MKNGREKEEYRRRECKDDHVTESAGVLHNWRRKNSLLNKWFNTYILLCVHIRARMYLCVTSSAHVDVCVCLYVRKLSTTPGERVLAQCQPNGQKLGHSELFNSFLGGEDASNIFP